MHLPRRITLALLLAASPALLLAACGGDDDDGVDGLLDGSPTPIENADPEELGQQVVDVYLEMLDELGNVVGDRPPPDDDVREEVAALRNEYTERLTELGWQVNYLDAEGRQTAQFTYEGSLFNLTPEQQQALGWYPAAVDSYRASDPEFAAELEDFSLLARYAFFDQLRIMDPEEADRIGVPE